MIGMKFFDILVWCPAKHVWPYCSWCQKVVFPAEDHRASHRHQRALQRAQDNGIAWTVREMLSRHCHRPQLHEMDHWLHASRGIGAPPHRLVCSPHRVLSHGHIALPTNRLHASRERDVRSPKSRAPHNRCERAVFNRMCDHMLCSVA